MKGQCDVCVLVDGDFSEDKTVKECAMCDAFLCEAHRGSLTIEGVKAIKARGRAALIRMGLIEGVAHGA